MQEFEKQLRELREKEQNQDIEFILKHPAGRRFMWRLLSFCGIYRDYEGTSDQILRNLGKRTVGLFLLRLLTSVNEDMVFEMMKEAKLRDEENDRIMKEIEEKIKAEGNLPSVDEGEYHA